MLARLKTFSYLPIEAVPVVDYQSATGRFLHFLAPIGDTP
ncbi:hypothetical protein HMPREF0576_0483 [Mobiluncus holmesii ATCC 35242]|uniref:Uncharacterized protein n=1 Tax=Mobiluncus holmesii ATCC 35242 TaxID=887899 RepID=E6M3K9_9ACTO|nr:hypothetical protein HMPREF0576_0483 [Mobiluncus holmesii ATCC 35242]STY88907.1 Uncharacterised protein [Mobiluncus holmesii]